MARIDDAIAACEKVDCKGSNGEYVSWAEFKAARDTVEKEYRDAMTEMSIRATRAHLAAAYASQE